MADQHFALVAALLAAVVAGGFALLGSFLTNRANRTRLKMEHGHQTQRRRSELLRERGEELYGLTDAWLKGLFFHYLNRTFVMQGKLTFDEYLNLEIGDGKGRTFDFGRIEMLIDVYFPSVRSQYDAVIAARTELNTIDREHKRAYEGGDVDGTRFLKPYVAAQHSIEEAGELLKKRIIESIQTL